MTPSDPPVRPPALSGPGERVRVTSPWTERPRAGTRRTAAGEIDAQSQVGEVYLSTLLRAQLRTAIGTLALLAVSVGLLPLVFWAAPGLTDRQVLGMPVSWGVLAFGCYPVLVGLAWRHVLLAERNERAFAHVVERSGASPSPGDGG